MYKLKSWEGKVMKKNKLIVFLVSLLTLLVVGLSVNTNTASAKYGYAGKTTTPKSVRGTWYYKGWRNGQKKIEFINFQ